jgi:hypothetical protein
METTTKKSMIVLLSTMLGLGLIVAQFVEPSSFTVQALTLNANLATGTWVNKNETTTNLNDSAFSPFVITSNGMDFLLTVGSFDASTSTAYYGTLNALSTSNHYNLSKSSSLSAFDALTNHAFEGALVMDEDLWNVSIQSLTMDWSNKSNDIYNTLAFVYSYDGGLTWSLDDNTKKTSFNDSALTATFSPTGIQGNRVRVGILSGKDSNTFGLSFTNPELTINYTTLSSEDSSNALKDEVILYTPCVTDTEGLILITEDKKNDLILKYNNLSSEAKTLFQSTSIGDGFTAYDRYILLTS